LPQVWSIMSEPEAPRAPGGKTGAEATPPAAQSRLGARYALFDELGAGGLATVYLGLSLGRHGLSRVVAVKRLHPDHARDPELVAMLADEARLAGQIHHENVVPVLDVVVVDGELMLVMPYVPGESLGRLLGAESRAGRAVPWRIAAALALDMLEGLHAAHEARDEHGLPLGIVHRDVSPQNLIVGVDGVARLTDFGIAKAAQRLQATRGGEVKGKLSYMSPEQLTGDAIDRRTDVWAASVVLWEMLAGRGLFRAPNAGLLIQQVLHGPIAAASELAAGIPHGLDELVMRGLSRSADSRPATAREMALALLAAAPELARPAEIAAWAGQLAADALGRRELAVSRLPVSAPGAADGEEAAEEEPATAISLERLSCHPVVRVHPSATADVPGPPFDRLDLTPTVPAARRDGSGAGRRRLGRRAIVVVALASVALLASIASMRLASRGVPSGSLGHDAGARVLEQPPGPPAARSSTALDHAPPPAVDSGPAVPSAPSAGARVEPTARPDAAPGRRRAAPSGISCDPPYRVDSDGIQRPKEECL
jgi:serine/threonine-protein kinase